MTPVATKLCVVALCGLLTGCSLWKPHSTVSKTTTPKATASKPKEKNQSDESQKPRTVNEFLAKGKPVRLPPDVKNKD